MDIHLPGVAFIIGCWQEHKNVHVRKCYANIVKTIKSTPSIEYIILSANHCAVSNFEGTRNHWAENTDRVFVSEQPIDYVRNQWQIDKEAKGWATPAELILHNNWQCECLLANSQWQVEYYLNHYIPNVQNLWYFGIGWTHGVMRDPIGWGQTCNLIEHNHIKNKNILTDTSCILQNLETHKNYALTDFATPDLTDWTLVEHGTEIFFKNNNVWKSF